jgi:hypothetical protein
MLDELLVSELTSGEEQAAGEHMKTCPACSNRARALREKRVALPSLSLPPRVRRWPSLGAFAMGGAIAAALALFVVFPRTTDSSSTRLKGGPRLSYFVKRGADTRPGGAGETVRAGDTLIFATSSAAPRFVAILSREGSGKASVYFPSGTRAEPVDAGREVVLPLATVLDDAVGTEQIYGLFCTSAEPLEPLRSALAATGRLPMPDGCAIDTLTLSKVR